MTFFSGHFSLETLLTNVLLVFNHLPIFIQRLSRKFLFIHSQFPGHKEAGRHSLINFICLTDMFYVLCPLTVMLTVVTKCDKTCDRGRSTVKRAKRAKTKFCQEIIVQFETLYIVICICCSIKWCLNV